MDKISRTEKNIQEALNSLNGMERADPGPFFFTRVQARLSRDEMSTWERISRFITRPAIAVLSIFLVISVNMLVVIKQTSAAAGSPEQSDMAVVDQYEQAISFYDIENVQP